MNDVVEHIDQNTGEVLTMEPPQMETGMSVQIKAEIDTQIATAKQYPRSLQKVRNHINDLVMLDEETAKECIYALPRGGKPIKGPSVRFAEIVASQYGNCHVGSRIVAVDRFEKVVIAEGIFIDYESGMRRTAQIRRRIVGRNGKLYSDDMIIVTGNAAASIAMREAILKGVPKALWRSAYEAAEHVIAGDVKTLAVRRENAMGAFAVFGVTPDQIFASLDVEGIDEITLDHIGTLMAMHNAIKKEEVSLEEYFPTKSDKKDGVDAAKGTAAKMAKIAGEDGQSDGDPAPKDQEPKAKADPEG